jgi:pentatricopeptide repeat protein
VAQSVKPDVVSYTLAMEACARARRWEASLEVLNEMTVRGVALDQRASLLALDVCAKANDWNKALLLLKDRGQSRECYERAMAAFGTAGEWEKVLWLLDRCVRWSTPAMHIFVCPLLSSLSGLCDVCCAGWRSRTGGLSMWPCGPARRRGSGRRRWPC